MRKDRTVIYMLLVDKCVKLVNRIFQPRSMHEIVRICGDNLFIFEGDSCVTRCLHLPPSERFISKDWSKIGNNNNNS